MNSITSFNLFYLILFMSLVNFFFFLLSFNKLLNVLISLEYMVLNLYMILCLISMMEMILNLIFYFLVIIVCEGAMGLSLLVSMARLGGNLKLNSSSFFLC